MKLETYFYVLGQGIQNIFKNRLMSIAAITTIAVSIFLVTLSYSITANLDYILENAENKIGVTVFFNEGTTEDRILEIKGLLENRKDVFKVNYISADMAWERFKIKYFEGREEQLAGYEGENPLEGSESLEVYFDDIDTSHTVVAYINSLPDVRAVKQAKYIVTFIDNMHGLVKFFSIILISILMVLSVFLIATTIKLGISTREKEIQIMKYIGATDMFIRGPFIIEGIIIGIIGSLVPLILVFVFYSETTASLLNQFSVLSDFLVFIPIGRLFSRLAPIALGSGMAVGFLGSILTLNRYLKV